jgi:hypothetical protein
MRGGKPGVYPPFKDIPFHKAHLNRFSLYDPLGIAAKNSPEKKASGLLKEINNGRLAMIGIMGFLAEAKVAVDDEGEEEATGAAGGGPAKGLRKKAVTREEREREQQEYASWLRHQLLTEHQGSGAVDDSVTLRRYLYGEQLDANERFLRDYVLNAMWKSPANANAADEDDEDGYDEGGGGVGASDVAARAAKAQAAAGAAGEPGEEEEEDCLYDSYGEALSEWGGGSDEDSGGSSEDEDI